MNNILSELEFEDYIIERLVQGNGYIERDHTYYDDKFAADRELLMRFLSETQPETMVQLKKVFKDKLEETLVATINAEATKERGSLLSVLKHGIELANFKLDLLYQKPATTFNKDAAVRYQKNIFSVMKEVWASDKERVDLVVFINGLAVIAIELKCNLAGQSYADAITQYRTERNPKTRLFRFKAGCLVCFAMDLNEVYMTTRLNGAATFFLPFNMGNGEGVHAGKGNPVYPDQYSVSYMWEDILTKDTLIDLIFRFIFIETKEEKDELTGKRKVKESAIFPRYHQLDVIRKLLADVEQNRTSQNYLIQHSAGSGKTNSIAWLAHRLASMHDAENKVIFDNIVIVPNGKYFISQSSVNCTEVACSPQEQDLALLKILSDHLPLGVTPVPLDKISVDKPEKGEHVLTIGFPRGYALFDDPEKTEIQANATAGSVTRTDGRFNFGLDAGISSGSSGSPIFDEYGDVIGVLNARHLGMNQAYAIRSEYLSSLLYEAGITK